MRHAFAATFLVLLTASVVWAQSGHLPADQIVAAIAEGARSKKLLMATAGSNTANEFVVTVRGPYGRVVSFAADKAMKYQTITAHEVPHDLAGLYLEVIAAPGKPAAGATAGTPPATQLVIRVKGDKAVVQPSKVEPLPVAWDNPPAPKLHGQGLRAVFDLSKIPQSGALEVVVTTREFERVYTFKEEERVRMK